MGVFVGRTLLEDESQMLTLYKRHTKECAGTRRKRRSYPYRGRITRGSGLSPPWLPHPRRGHAPYRRVHTQDNRRGEVAEGRRIKREGEMAGGRYHQRFAARRPTPQAPPRVEHVIEQFSRDRTACKLSPSTLKKYRQFTDQLREFCAERGVV